MRQLAGRRLLDRVVLHEPRSITPGDVHDVDPDTGRPVAEATGTDPDMVEVLDAAASVHTVADTRDANGERIAAPADRRVWLAIEHANIPQVGHRVQITTARNPALTGQWGTIHTVERDSVRALTRFDMRLDVTR